MQLKSCQNFVYDILCYIKGGRVMRNFLIFGLFVFVMVSSGFSDYLNISMINTNSNSGVPIYTNPYSGFSTNTFQGVVTAENGKVTVGTSFMVQMLDTDSPANVRARGILIYQAAGTTATLPAVTRGQIYEFTGGTNIQFQGSPEIVFITNANFYTLLGTSTLPLPILDTTTNFNNNSTDGNNNAESYESMMIYITNAMLTTNYVGAVTGTTFPTTGTTRRYTFNDGTGLLEMCPRYGSGLGSQPIPAGAGPYACVGVHGQRMASGGTYVSNYQIWPRDIDDLMIWQSNASVAFSSTSYLTDSYATINILDMHLIARSSTNRLVVFSGADPAGFTITYISNQNNKNVAKFTNHITFTRAASDSVNQKLSVTNNDTVYVVYYDCWTGNPTTNSAVIIDHVVGINWTDGVAAINNSYILGATPATNNEVAVFNIADSSVGDYLKTLALTVSGTLQSGVDFTTDSLKLWVDVNGDGQWDANDHLVGVLSWNGAGKYTNNNLDTPRHVLLPSPAGSNFVITFDTLGTEVNNHNFNPTLLAGDVICSGGKGNTSAVSNYTPFVIVRPYKISEVTVNDSTGMPLMLNQIVLLTNVVITTSNGVAATYASFYAQDKDPSTANHRGIDVYGTGTPNIIPGYVMNMMGQILDYRGMVELQFNASDTNFAKFWVTNQLVTNDNPVAPIPISTGLLANGSSSGNDGAEMYDNMLVYMTNVKFADHNGSYFYDRTNYTINDGSGNTVLYIRNDPNGLNSNAVVPDVNQQCQLYGIVVQEKTAAPYTSGYRLHPRGVLDLITNAADPNASLSVDKQVISGGESVQIKVGEFNIDRFPFTDPFMTNSVYVSSTKDAVGFALTNLFLEGFTTSTNWTNSITAGSSTAAPQIWADQTGDQIFVKYFDQSRNLWLPTQTITVISITGSVSFGNTNYSGLSATAVITIKDANASLSEVTNIANTYIGSATTNYLTLSSNAVTFVSNALYTFTANCTFQLASPVSPNTNANTFGVFNSSTNGLPNIIAVYYIDQNPLGNNTYATSKFSDRAPIADAGKPKTYRANEPVTLDGSASRDDDGDPIKYSWSQQASDPVQVTLSSKTIYNPTFTPTKGGKYNFTLTVNDYIYDSIPADVPTVTITVSSFEPGIDNAYPEPQRFLKADVKAGIAKVTFQKLTEKCDIVVYDILGNKVAEFSAVQGAGKCEWSIPSYLASGVYIVLVKDTATGTTITRKIMLK